MTANVPAVVEHRGAATDAQARGDLKAANVAYLMELQALAARRASPAG